MKVEVLKSHSYSPDGFRVRAVQAGQVCDYEYIAACRAIRLGRVRSLEEYPPMDQAVDAMVAELRELKQRRIPTNPATLVATGALDEPPAETTIGADMDRLSLLVDYHAFLGQWGAPPYSFETWLERVHNRGGAS